MATEYTGLPVHGYVQQSGDKVKLVNRFKEEEERILRSIEALSDARVGGNAVDHDPRWAWIAKTHFQEGFMALNRSIFQPQRIALPEDRPSETPKSAA